MSVVSQLESAAKKSGLEIVVKKQNVHYQILGGNFLVNYYPYSSNQVAYVAGTVKGIKHVSPRQAVQLANSIPKKIGGKVKRKRRNRARLRKIKERLMLSQSGKCCWDKYGGGCKLPGTQMIDNPPYNGDDQATIEHVVPLGRQGLDNLNNIKLAHRLCNESREKDFIAGVKSENN